MDYCDGPEILRHQTEFFKEEHDDGGNYERQSKGEAGEACLENGFPGCCFARGDGTGLVCWVVDAYAVDELGVAHHEDVAEAGRGA